MIKKFFKSALRILILLVFLAAIIAAGMLMVKRKEHALVAAPKFGIGPIPDRAARAQQGSLSEKRQYLAVVEPNQNTEVAARITARIEKVLCDEGDTVKANQEIAVLDSREIRDHIASVAAQIKQVEEELRGNQVTVQTLTKTVEYWARELARARAMQRDKAIAASEVDATADKLQETQGKLDAARHRTTALEQSIHSLNAELARLKTTLDYCTIHSPFNGVVARRLVDAGDLATPGKSLFIIEDRTVMKLAFDVPQQDLPQIHPGLDVLFRVNGKPRVAQLTRLYPSLNVARMVRAEVDLPGTAVTGLSSGAYISVSVVLRRLHKATLLPVSALIPSPKGEPHVFVIKDNILVFRPVKVKVAQANKVAVEGVKPGELVVVNRFLGWTRYSPGQKVEVIE